MALGRGAEERGSFSWYFSFKRKKLKKWHIRLISTLWKVIQFWGLTFFQGWVARGAEVVWGHSPVGWISMHLPAWRILTYALNSREDTNAPITRADTLLGRVPMHLSLGRIRVQSPTGRKPMHSPAGWTPRYSQLRWITMSWAKKLSNCIQILKYPLVSIIIEIILNRKIWDSLLLLRGGGSGGRSALQ